MDRSRSYHTGEVAKVILLSSTSLTLCAISILCDCTLFGLTGINGECMGSKKSREQNSYKFLRCLYAPSWNHEISKASKRGVRGSAS